MENASITIITTECGEKFTTSIDFKEDAVTWTKLLNAFYNHLNSAGYVLGEDVKAKFEDLIGEFDY